MNQLSVLKRARRRVAGQGSHDVHVPVMSAEKMLITELLSRYEEQGRHGRPVTDSMNNLTVYFGLTLIQILDVDESNQVLKCNVWFHYVSAC